MIVTSTPAIEGKKINVYLGIVMGSTVRALTVLPITIPR